MELCTNRRRDTIPSLGEIRYVEYLDAGHRELGIQRIILHIFRQAGYKILWARMFLRSLSA